MRAHRLEACAVAALTSVLGIWLVADGEYGLAPATTLPPFVVEVDGASIGPEVSDEGRFWTIDTASATIVATNTGSTQRTTRISFELLDGPCASGQQVEVRGGRGGRSVAIPPGERSVVELDDLTVGPYEDVRVVLTPTKPACPPFDTDPRSIAFQIYDLQASTG